MTDSRALEPFPEDWERALVIVAHPDDIEWGMSAAVAVWTDGGRDVSYLLVTRGEAGIAGMEPAVAGPAREAEERASAAIVGVSSVSFLDHSDGRVEEGLVLRRELAGAIRRVRPEVVATLNPSDRWGSDPGAGWNSADHRAVGRSVLDAVADAANAWIFPELLDDDGLEPWAGTRWVALSGSAQPTHAVDVSAHLDQAVASLAAHRAYLEALQEDDPEAFARRLVEQSTAAVASRFGGRAAVAFEVLGG